MGGGVATWPPWPIDAPPFDGVTMFVEPPEVGEPMPDEPPLPGTTPGPPPTEAPPVPGMRFMSVGPPGALFAFDEHPASVVSAKRSACRDSL
jgi:hypothetical protein